MGIENKFIDILEKSILNVFNEDGSKIEYNTLEIKDYKSKYSSSGKAKRTLFLDGIPYTGNRKIKVQYQCSCGCIQTILLKKFMLKEVLNCRVCVEHDANKIAWQKEYFLKKREGKKRGNKEKKKKDYIFEKESIEFQTNYYQNNLTKEEFEDISKYIFSIDGIRITDKVIRFLPHEPCFNAKKYRNMVQIDGQKHNLKNIVLKCSTCGSLYKISRPLKKRVTENNFKCKYCYLVNHNFMIHKYEDGLTYQSNEELRFIELCKKNEISIKDGPKIKYLFNGSEHTYYIDFQLPFLKYNVEIKDNHVWHRKQIESGVWDAKKNSAIKFSKENGSKYVILFPKDIDDFITHLKR